MTVYRFTVSYEGEIEAPDPDTAQTWAQEEVEYGHYTPVIVEAVPATLRAESVVTCTCHGNDLEPYCPRHSKEPHEHAGH